MPCRYEEELVAYLHEELSPTMKHEVESHLLDCTSCREELARLRALRALLHTELPPIEPSARFRLALARRLSEIASRQASCPLEEETSPAMPSFPSSSEKENRPSTLPPSRLEALSRYFPRRGSPWFASLLVHAAVMVVLIALFLSLRDFSSSSRSSLSKVQTDLAPLPPDESSIVSAWKIRKAAFQFRSEVRWLDNQALLDIAERMSEGEVVLQRHPTWGCVQVFLPEHAGNPGMEDLLHRHEGAVPARVQNALLAIPLSLARSSFGHEASVRVFDLCHTLEIWSESQWQRFEQRATGFLSRIDPPSVREDDFAVLAFLSPW